MDSAGDRSVVVIGVHGIGILLHSTDLRTTCSMSMPLPACTFQTGVWARQCLGAPAEISHTGLEADLSSMGI